MPSFRPTPARPPHRAFSTLALLAAALAGCSSPPKPAGVEYLVPASYEKNWWYDGSGFEGAVPRSHLGRDSRADQTVRIDWHNGARTPEAFSFLTVCTSETSGWFLYVSAESDDASIVDGSASVTVDSAPGSAIPPTTAMTPSPQCAPGDVSARFKNTDFPNGAQLTARYRTEDGKEYAARLAVDPPDPSLDGRSIGRALEPPFTP